jgi:hypothetical protein
MSDDILPNYDFHTDVGYETDTLPIVLDGGRFLGFVWWDISIVLVAFALPAFIVVSTVAFLRGLMRRLRDEA